MRDVAARDAARPRTTPPGPERRHQAQNDATRARFRRKAQALFPDEVRQQLLDAIYDRKPFRQALRDLGLTSNQVWGLTKTDEEWSKRSMLRWQRHVETTCSTALIPRTCRDVHAANAGSTSAFGWARERLELPSGLLI
jgi:hypothetical protein